VFLALGPYAERVHNVPQCPLLTTDGAALDAGAYGRKRLAEEQKAFEKAMKVKTEPAMKATSSHAEATPQKTCLKAGDPWDEACGAGNDAEDPI
jgi:hypothetical protein